MKAMANDAGVDTVQFRHDFANSPLGGTFEDGSRKLQRHQNLLLAMLSTNHLRHSV